MLRLQRNKSTDLVINTSDWKGKTYVQAREYSTYGNDEPGGLPTKKGIAFRPGELDAVIDELVVIRDRFRQQGVDTDTAEAPS